MSGRYDWSKFGRPGVARFVRVARWVNLMLAVVADALFSWFALTWDWTVIFAALVVTVATGVNWVATRKIYAADPKRPDYSAIARMEREVWGETFTHAEAPAVATLPSSIRATRPDGSFPIADKADLERARALLGGCTHPITRTSITTGRSACERCGEVLTEGTAPGGMQWRLQNGITTIDQERERLIGQIKSNFGVPPAICDCDYDD